MSSSRSEQSFCCSPPSPPSVKFVTLLNASLNAYLYIEIHWEIIRHNEDNDQVKILRIPRIQSMYRQIDPTEGHGRIQPPDCCDITNGHVKQAIVDNT